MGKRTYHWVTLLEDLVNGNQRFERLNFVSQYGLHTEASPEGDRGMVIPSVDDTFWSTGLNGPMEHELMDATHFGHVSAWGRSLRDWSPS